MLLFAHELLAQSISSENIDKSLLKLVCTNTDGTVKLRWAPLDQEVWQLGIEHGYIIERNTVNIDTNESSDQSVILGDEPILPAPYNTWEMESKHNDYALLIADAFYSETKAKKRGTSSPTAVFMNSLLEHNDKFTFSLLAADLNYNAALLAGWGYVDNSVSSDATYEYIVYLNHPDYRNIAKDTIRVNMTRKTNPPVPVGVDVSFGDGYAKLSWLQNVYNHPIVAYNIEHSFDNENFFPLNQTPILSSGKGPALYTDTIPNDTYMFYRLRTIDCFGEISGCSKVVSGEAKRVLTASPNNLWHTYLNYDTISIHWDFDPSQHDLIIGFEVYRSKDSYNNYKNVSFFLPITSRSFNFPASDRNYLIVKAVGRGSYSTTSAPYFASRPDLVPPEQPQGLTGTIDTTGIIQLKWNANNDSDLQGYLLFASHLKNNVYVPTTKEAFSETFYTDTINIRSGYRSKFYKLFAVDSAGNESEPSEILHIAIPDMMKPHAPLIRNTLKRADTIRIEWLPSISDDVLMQLVYRKEIKEEKWRILKRIDDNTTKKIEDTGLENGKTYSYLIVAVDSAGWESDPSKPATLSVSYKIPPGNIEGLAAKFNQQELSVELSWKNMKNIRGYQLYKDEGEGDNYYFLSFVDATENKFTDVKIKPFKAYNYKIRAVSNEGLYSRFETVRIEWK